MKTTDLLLLGGVAVGGYFLLKSPPAQAQPAPTPTPTPPWDWAIPPWIIEPQPKPAPTPAGGFDLSGSLSQITQIALDLLPQGPPSITIGPTTPADGVSTLPNSSSWFSDYNFGPGWDIFKPGEVHFGV